ERILGFPLVINFYNLIFFDNRHSCFMTIGGDYQLLRHHFLPRSGEEHWMEGGALRGSRRSASRRTANLQLLQLTLAGGGAAIPHTPPGREAHSGERLRATIPRSLPAPKNLIHKPSEADVVDQPQSH